jgi:phosphoribosyl 1,2-cyclic phosphate phosphodiesterase
VKGTLTVLGSGTSMGVPTIACQCAVCRSTDPRDKRMRPSVMLQFTDAGGHPRTILIDTSPDFRTQAIREDMRRLDAVLITHAHADHILGLDDVRAFNFHQRAKIPVYANATAWATIRKTFHYIFEPENAESIIPAIDVHEIDEPVELFGITFTPVPVFHGKLPVLGFRFGRNAYLTDFNVIPEASQALLEDLDVLFLDALRDAWHPTHCTVADALNYAAQLCPKVAYFTHMNHELGHEATSARLPAGVFLSYDGLKLEVEF